MPFAFYAPFVVSFIVEEMNDHVPEALLTLVLVPPLRGHLRETELPRSERSEDRYYMMKRYEINDTVFYGVNGVCRISAIEQLCFKSDPDDYYILRPVYNSTETIFVPIGNQTLCDRIRPVMTKEQLEGLIALMTENAPDWIEDNNTRRTAYSEILQSAKPEKVLSVLRSLHTRSEALRQKKKRLHVSDERLFHDAERMLYGEIAYVAGIRVEDVGSYIARELERLTR